jgi:hypothetical protein
MRGLAVVVVVVVEVVVVVVLVLVVEVANVVCPVPGCCVSGGPIALSITIIGH